MNFSNYIGKIVLSKFIYYDIELKSYSTKVRPVLIIGIPDSNTISPDFNVLPVSTIKNRYRISKIYDYEIILHETSYIRTHKQSIINIRDIEHEILDLKKDRKEDWEKVINLHKEFQKYLY